MVAKRGFSKSGNQLSPSVGSCRGPGKAGSGKLQRVSSSEKNRDLNKGKKDKMTSKGVSPLGEVVQGAVKVEREAASQLRKCPGAAARCE